MKKSFRRLLAAAIVAGSLFTASPADAEVKTYEAIGEYYMSDFETFDVAQQRAKKRAEQAACEQAGVFVKSYSRSVNSKLVEDEIIAMTSGILKVINVQFQREYADNTTLIRATIKAQIDSDDIGKWNDLDANQRNDLISQYEALRKAYDEQEKQLAELRGQAEKAATQEERKRITQEFVAEDKIFLSNQKAEEATTLWKNKDYSGAIKLCNEALKLNQNNSIAYGQRGTAYLALQNYGQALVDFNKAIELNPNFAVMYNNRGVVYNNLQNYGQALVDYNKAIELDPKLAYAYTNRGFVYNKLQNYGQALVDFNKSIDLDSNFARAYADRGNVYYKLQNYGQALVDYNKAIELDPKDALTYNNRGTTYFELQNYGQALVDYNKAIKLDPNNAVAYACRGLCYQKLGENAKAQADFAKAKQLGFNG